MRTKYDWERVIEKAQSRPGEWVLAFRDSPVALRDRIRWRQGVALERLPPHALSSVASKTYKPDGQVKPYGDIWIRWNGEVPAEPPLRLPEEITKDMTQPGRRRSTEEARSRGWAVAKSSSARKELCDKVREVATAASVPMTAIVNAVVADIANPESNFQPKLPEPKAPPQFASLNATVKDEVWAAALARAEEIGLPLWQMIKEELAERVGFQSTSPNE